MIGSGSDGAFRVRAATAEDAPALLALWATLFDEMTQSDETTQSDEIESSVHQPWQAYAWHWFERVVGDASSARFPVVEVDERIVATAIGTLELGVPNPHCRSGRTVRLANVVTVPAHRRRGFASQCVLDVIAWAKIIAADRVDLSATARAQPLYERLGFTVTSAPRMKLPL